MLHCIMLFFLLLKKIQPWFDGYWTLGSAVKLLLTCIELEYWVFCAPCSHSIVVLFTRTIAFYRLFLLKYMWYDKVVRHDGIYGKSCCYSIPYSMQFPKVRWRYFHLVSMRICQLKTWQKTSEKTLTATFCSVFNQRGYNKWNEPFYSYFPVHFNYWNKFF